MKKILFYSCLFLLFACNNQSNGGGSKNDSTSPDKKSGSENISASSSGCGSSMLFHEGLTITTISTSGTGDTLNRSVATVAKVINEGNITIAQMEAKIKDATGAEKVTRSTYKCDGQNFVVDVSSLVGENNPGVSIEGDGFNFPLSISDGQTLPDATYSITTNKNGKTMKITSTVKERKVIGKESITIDGGTFECYKIAGTIDAYMHMDGMDAAMQKRMDEARSKMPKSSIILWYAPMATVLKTQVMIGEKLISSTQVVAIKK
jgi:hypothetical protein